MSFKFNKKSVIRLSSPNICKANDKLIFLNKKKPDERDHKSLFAQSINACFKNPDYHARKSFIASMKTAKDDAPDSAVDKFASSKSGLTFKVAEGGNKKELGLLHLADRLEQLEQENEGVLEQLWELNSKYNALVSNIPAITYFASLENPGKLLYLSPQIKNLGYTVEDWLQDSQGLFTYIHQDDYDYFIEMYQKASENHRPLSCEYRITAKNGQIRWLRNDASVIRDEKNKMAYFHGNLTDISRDKEIEQELFYYRNRLDYLVEQRTQQLEKNTPFLNLHKKI